MRKYGICFSTKRLITAPLEIGFVQSSVNVQDLENLQLHQQQLQLPPPPPLLLRQQPPLLQHML